mmetsp:Transcript_61441/g.90118  ORF Transcript_61441/g.90118 Transcript_61441/m.90118 type:complete len:386 (+) Transcript_61441:78-1235(+)
MGFDDPPPPPYTPDDCLPVHAPPPAVPMAQAMQREISLPDVLNQSYGRSITRQERETYLASTNMPKGLAEEMVRSCEEFPLRIWIIDNSGSMATSDGHRPIQKPGGKEGLVDCSRWAELGDSLQWHATMAAFLAAPTEFRLLNPPEGGAMQVLECGVGPEPTSEIKAVQQMLASGPRGVTPLCAQIRQVVARVRREEGRLRAKGQKCIVVIASDGQASDGNVEVELRPLRELPVWLVVRLCTDEDNVVEYWNGIDEDIELEMDVLDDLSGEAAEITEQNPWLTYATPLHRIREWGTSNKFMDFLDEKRLTSSEFVEFAKIIFGRDATEGLPHPTANWPGFKEKMLILLSKTPLVWDPLRERKRPWVSMKKLQRCYKPGGASCAIS